VQSGQQAVRQIMCKILRHLTSAATQSIGMPIVIAFFIFVPPKEAAQRWASAAAGSGSAADAGGSRLHAMVRRG